MFKELFTNQNFQNFQNPKHALIERDLALIVYSMDYYNSLNENLLTEGSINDYLAKLGLTFHKAGPGVIDYIIDFAKGTGRIFMAAMNGDKEEMKKIASTLTKEEVIDFLLKLDAATLHIVTGPIHTIDALTGWDLWANVKAVSKRAKSVLEDIWAAIAHLKSKVTQNFKGSGHDKKIISRINKVERMIPLAVDA